MDYFIAILIFGAVVAFFVYMSVTAHIEWERRKMLGFMKETPSMDDSIEAAKEALHFICDRMEGDPRRWDECSTGGDGFFTMLNSTDIANFFRYAHFAGCHIIIKQVSDKDIEDPKNTKEVFREWESDMARARARRIERRYR